MTESDFKTSVLLLAMLGVAIVVVGMTLYALSSRIAGLGYLLLPIPPIAVASYIYVTNWMANNDLASLKGGELHAKLQEVFLQTLVGGLIFIVITVLIMLGLILSRGLLPESG